MERVAKIGKLPKKLANHFKQTLLKNEFVPA